MTKKKKVLSQEEMSDEAKKRSTDYEKLSPQQQWEVTPDYDIHNGLARDWIMNNDDLYFAYHGN